MLKFLYGILTLGCSVVLIETKTLSHSVEFGKHLLIRTFRGKKNPILELWLYLLVFSPIYIYIWGKILINKATV